MHRNETLIFLDIEATLIKGKQHIIEIGALKWTPENTIESFEQLIKPSQFKKLNYHIQNLTGITTEEIIQASPFQTVIQDFIQWCGGTVSEKIIVTFGEFDRKVLEEEFERHHLNKDFLYPIVDYQQKYMIAHQLKNQPSLNRLMESLNLEIEQQHRALADANSLLKIFTETNGYQLIENQKTNDFACLVCNLVQNESVYEAYVTYIIGRVESENISINDLKTIKRELPFQIREVEKLSADGESSIVQVYDIQPNQDLQKFLNQLTQLIENKLLITLTGLKTLSKLFRIHEMSLRKTETMTLKQFIEDENELNQYKLNGDFQNDELTLHRIIDKFQHVILEEFKIRSLLKNEVRI